MRATITLLVVVVVVVASQEPSPGHPPCQAYTTSNEVRIPVPKDLKELDLWFSFQERECEVSIAVVTNTKGKQSGPLKVNIKERHHTQPIHFFGSSSSHDEDNTSWCRVRLTQPVKGVNNSRLTAAGHCGNNRKKEEQYTDDDVTALLVKTNNNIVFNVCPVPPHPVCPTGTWRPRGKSRTVEPPVSNTPQCPIVCPDPPPESGIPNCSTACPESSAVTSVPSSGCPDQQQQQQQQGATVVLGVLLGVCLLACVALATAHCYNKASFRDMMARSPFQLSTSKQFLWPSRGTNNQSANQDATQGANQGASQDANQGANQDSNQGATQGANQGARPGGRASAHDSENSLYGATIDRQ
ncbi:uncharacterized protein [Procambarus clarkii]|uniref:uncharacterized protein n=1 Tax=Procambarus clarkii TaxID=6728 RepID=UPI0037423D13